MLILTFISSDQDLIHIVTQTDCTFCGAACGNVIGGDDCVGIMVSGNLVTVTVRARPGLQVLICSGIKEHTGHGLIDMIREIKF